MTKKMCYDCRPIQIPFHVFFTGSRISGGLLIVVIFICNLVLYEIHDPACYSLSLFLRYRGFSGLDFEAKNLLFQFKPDNCFWSLLILVRRID